MQDVYDKALCAMLSSLSVYLLTKGIFVYCGLLRQTLCLLEQIKGD
jgi:hypothetical protein